MNTQAALLIDTLLDQSALLADRDDAAMDLGAYNDDNVLDALIRVARNKDEHEMILASCGESIADIWLARRYYNQEVFDSLTNAAQHEVYVNADVSKNGTGK